MNIRADIALIERIAAELEPYREEDTEAFWTTLDGETDILDILDRAIASYQHDLALVEAIKEQAAAMKARSDRIAARADTVKRIAGTLLKAAGMKSAERPRATVSVRPGNQSVAITDEADIPSQLMREKISRSPDKVEIKKQLDAGEKVPGAELRRGDDIITVRTK